VYTQSTPQGQGWFLVLNSTKQSWRKGTYRGRQFWAAAAVLVPARRVPCLVLLLSSNAPPAAYLSIAFAAAVLPFYRSRPPPTASSPPGVLQMEWGRESTIILMASLADLPSLARAAQPERLPTSQSTPWLQNNLCGLCCCSERARYSAARTRPFHPLRESN
jgi:hypothetical protein